VLFAVLAVVVSAVTQCTGGSLALRRVDLRVLVLNHSSYPSVSAVRDELKLEGVPYTEINLQQAGRQQLTTDYLSSVTGTNPVTERAKFQAVVLPNDTGVGADGLGLSQAERDVLFAFEAKYGVRQVNAGQDAKPGVGLNWAQAPTGFISSLDGMTGTVTPAGLASPFKYLAGPVPFEVGSYGYVATPLSPLPANTTFTPMVTVPVPGSATPGSIVGSWTHDGREEMLLTVSMNALQQQFRLLGRGIVTWMTKGVHLGYDRTYLSVHVDDLFAADNRWNSALNCTPGEDCPAGTPEGTPVRMTAADVSAVVAWQNANGFKFDMVYNGFGADSFMADNGGVDPLLNAVKTNKAAFRFVNHTYTHQFLGCIQNTTVIPWQCQKDAAGNIQYLAQAAIQDEITKNITFSTTHGLPIDKTELVTGEHSGLYILPQQPADNPNLAPAFTATGIKVAGADASRQFDPRTVGPARTLPRYPMANFFNVGTKAEMADEYNWIFTSAAAGGSGLCTANPATMTCLTPVNATTGYTDFIVPLDTTVTLRHMLGNDPRPHYVHQSNLSEERILLTLMDSVLGRYKGLFNATAPIVQPTMTQASNTLSQQAAWATGANQVEAYTLGNEVYVNRNGYTGLVPLTTPTGTKTATGAAWGEAYAGELSAWTPTPATGSLRLVLVAAP
jgi:hypothetical protein